MPAPYFTEEEIRNFERIPQSITDRQAIDSVIYNIMEGIAQLVALQGGNSTLSEMPTGRVYSDDEQFTRLVSELEENNKILREIKTYLQGMYS